MDFEKEWGKPEANTFIVQNLETIVTARHKVAHRLATLNVSRSDLAMYVKFLKTLTSILAKHLTAFVDEIVATCT